MNLPERPRNNIVNPISLTLEVSDEIQRASRIPGSELQERLLIELGCALYQRQILPFGKAAELCHLNQFKFGHELVSREIPRTYPEAKIEEDLPYANR